MSKCTVSHRVELSDIITPLSCSSYIIELIKYVAYIKQQIPFPFERLKMYVLKRRERQKYQELACTPKELNVSNRITIQMEKYYKKVEEAFEILDDTFKCIEVELLKPTGHLVKEVVLIFGSTLISPKDIYRFKIPSFCHGHSDAQHLMKRQLANLFRGIILSDTINDNLQRRVGLTNMFVMLKVKRKERSAGLQWLLPKDHYQLSNRAQQVCFTFKTTSMKPCTCLQEDNPVEVMSGSMAALRVGDFVVATSSANDTDMTTETDEHFMWFQTPRSLKGFKDCKMRGVSITDLWYKYSFI